MTEHKGRKKDFHAMKDNHHYHNVTTENGSHGNHGTDKRQYFVKKGHLRIIPLGGLGEIGRNMTAFEYEDDIIIVDCGLMFPRGDMYGIDSIIPNTKYLEENKHKIRAMIITHGHEDHAGAVPYIIPKLHCPIYTAKLTAALLEEKISEFGIGKPSIHVVSPGQKLVFGVFQIEFIGLSHTIPDELGLIMDTPLGRFVYIVDFKIDYRDPSQQPVLLRLKELAKTKVRCLFLDSTNAEIEGQSVSEVQVKESIDQLVAKAKGRVIVTSFASSISRIQSVMDAAKTYHRKVAVAGRSMEKTIRIAKDIGYLRISDGLIVPIKNIHKFPKDEIIILCTGSQGEEYAALVRMASGEHKQIKIEPGDTVIISASAVPGNERSIADTVNNLFREGAEVIYGGEQADIHASGHAKADELRMMLAMIGSEYFIPIHGEYRHLVRNAQLAQNMGVDPRKIIVAENGEVIEFNQEKGQLTQQKVPSGYVLVDGLGVGDVGNIVLRDRQAMAKDGIFVVILTVDHETGKIVTSPDIISRGFVYMRAAEELIFKARQEIRKMFTHHNEKFPMNWDYIKRTLRDELGEFLFNQTQRRPMVIPVIIEV
ncbi:MAG: ribonuclease J [Patescibacteria group bacterium]|nr:ribonuclease J [Patescibacteria group bacterium]